MFNNDERTTIGVVKLRKEHWPDSKEFRGIISLQREDDNKPYGILTTAKPADALEQRAASAEVEPTRVVLGAVNKTGAHASGASIATSITITATPRQQSVGHDVTITGQLTGGGAPIAGAPVNLYVDDAGSSSQVSERVTDANGSYAFLVEQPTAGTRTLKVAYPGSVTLRPCVSDELSVTYVTIDATITAAATPSEQLLGQNVTIAGQLMAGGTPVAGALVTLFNIDDAAQPVRIAESATDASGHYQFELTDTAPGHHTYVAHAPGTSSYASVQSSEVSVTYVVLPPTAITATAIRSQQAGGESVTISGQLTAGGAPIPNATVSLYSVEDIAENAPVATTSTDTAGHFQLSPLAVTPATSYAYIVHYAGDGEHAPAQSSKIMGRGGARLAAAFPAKTAQVEAPVQATVQEAPVQAPLAPRSARDDEASTKTKESQSNDITQVKSLDMTANPAALGFTALGVTTVLLSLSNAGYFGLNSMILAMGIFYGGLGQVIAAVMEWRKGNTFGTTAFMSFGLFWLTLVALLVLPKLGLADAPSLGALEAYFAMWGLFTFIMFVGSLKANRATPVVLGLLTILFVLLAWAQHTGNVTVTGSTTITQIAGYEGILTGFAAVYAGLMQVLKEMWKRTVTPI
jgi:hypothetical protein